MAVYCHFSKAQLHNVSLSNFCGGSDLQVSAKVLKVALRHVEDEHGQQRHSKDDTTALGSYDELKTAVGQEVGLGITVFCCIWRTDDD